MVARVRRKSSEDVESRAKADAAAIASIKARGARLDGAGSEIVDVAPARGEMAEFREHTQELGKDGRLRRVDQNFKGMAALRRLNALEVMDRQSQRRSKPGEAVGFTKQQHHAASSYAALFERVATAGVRCSSLEAQAGGSGGGGSFIDAVIRDSRELSFQQMCIGSSVLIISKRGHKAGTCGGLRVLDLVHRVCLEDYTFSDVLVAGGWSVQTHRRVVLRVAFCDALDRMAERNVLPDQQNLVD